MSSIFLTKSNPFKRLEFYIDNYKVTNEDKERVKILKQFELEMQKILNVEKFQLGTFTLMMGTFTIPTPLHVFRDDLQIVKNKNGVIGFNKPKDNFIIVMIDHGLIMELESPEVLAIILHEVGHNIYRGGQCHKIMNTIQAIPTFFYRFILNEKLYKNIRLFTNIKIFVNIITSLVYKFLFLEGKTASFVKALIMQITVATNIFENVTKILTLSDEEKATNLAVKLGKKTAAEAISVTTKLIEIVRNFITVNVVNVLSESYSNEKFSDNYAVIHGYGVPLASAMAKVDRSLGMRPESSINMSILSNLYEVVSHLTAVHPSILKRLDNSIEILQKEINRNSDPVIKRILTKDLKGIEEIKKQHDELLKKVPTSNLVTSITSNIDDFRNYMGKLVGAQEIDTILTEEVSNLLLTMLNESSTPDNNIELYLAKLSLTENKITLTEEEIQHYIEFKRKLDLFESKIQNI